MSQQPQRIAVLGFTPLERVTFEALFRLSGRRHPAYEAEPDWRDADFVLVDADHELACQYVVEAGLLPRCVVLGATARPGAGFQLPRPIDHGTVLRAFDALSQSRPARAEAVERPAVASAAPAVSATPPRPQVDLLVHTEPQPIAWPMLLDIPGEPGLDGQPVGLDHILVVDDNDLALRFMAVHLNRFGFQVHLARSGAGALARLAKRHFEFVFVDEAIASMGGFELCKAIKDANADDHRPPPTVVLMSQQQLPAHALRVTMAGCDACLAKPLMELDLLNVVGDREVQQHGYASTMDAAPTLL